MLLNLDIWHEIISQLKYTSDRSTLCSLAVTSRSISKLALDSLWRSGGTIRAIVSVINTFAPSANEPFLRYIDDDESDDEDSTSSARVIIGWVLDKPIPPAACERARGYMARIRCLAVHQTGSFEELLWPILSTCLDSHGPLLPNLESLEITFYIYDRNEYLIPLLSPSLKTLLITCERPPKLNAVLTLLNLAKARGCDLEVFEYIGNPIHHIPVTISLFKNLRRVSLPPDYTPELWAPITIVQFLTSLPSLRSLTCPIGTFSPSTGEDQFRHTNLKELVIGSQTAASLRELFHTCVFPFVTDVRIASDAMVSMEGIQSSCPNARQIDLEFNAVEPLSEFDHLSPLFSLPIQSFHLSVNEHALTPSDLRSLGEAWPNMLFLKITSETLFEPLPSLAAFSNHPCLNTLNIPLSLFHLLDDIHKQQDLRATDAPLGSSCPPLRTLFLGYGGTGSHPTRLSTTKIRVVVEYLLRLFPSLEELEFSELTERVSSVKDNLGNFQEILVKLRKEREGFLNPS